jgi:hypothetical protein
MPARVGKLKRRDMLKLGLSGMALACLNGGCENKTTPNPPDSSEPVYELTDGKTLYDDFDGHGCLQSYNNQDLAEAGKLSSALWSASTDVAEVVEDPAARGLLAVVNENRQRIERPASEGASQEGERVGRLCPGSRKLFWLGVRDGRYESANGPVVVEKGKIYGTAELNPIISEGWVLKLAARNTGFAGCLLIRRRDLGFADFRRFSADVMVPSSATGRDYWASLDCHTTIPEQPPGLSWFTEIGIRKFSSGEILLFAQTVNRNTEYRVTHDFGKAQPDTWYNLRMDVVTQRDDPAVKANEFRVDYYVNGEWKDFEFPWDSEILLDPQRTGGGPDRYVRLLVENPEGESSAYFDNVRAVYSNRVK